MPRYYFHLRHEHQAMDGEGVILPDLQAAVSEAVRTFGEMLRLQDGSVSPDLPFEMTVADEGGNPVCRLHFSAEFPRARDESGPP